MQELRLLFTPSENGSFAVRLEDTPGHTIGVPATLTPFLSEDDYENLRWYLEDYMDLPDGGAVVRAQGVEAQLKKWGEQLHDAVFAAPENAALLKQLLAAPEPRELTIATDRSALLRLPWELMADAVGSLAQRVAVRRQLETPESLIAREVKLPLRILYIVSRPADTGFIDPRLTTRALFAALDPLQGNVRLDFCRPPTAARMEEMLREAQAANDPYDLVHFDGHGNFLPEAQIGALCFELLDDGSGESKTDHVRADRLGDLLAKYKIPLVVLEACRSATVGKTAVFRSVAPRLIRAGVGSVLSMGHAVHVEAARLLLDRFYRELARGATIGQAVAEARTVLQITSDRWIEQGPNGRRIKLRDWFLPHLYQRGLDEPLLPPDAAKQQTVRQFEVFLSHNHNDSVRVEKLARTLAEKHGLRVWLDKWECGPGKLEPQCERGIRDSRFTVVVGSQAALNSKWVAWEIAKHFELNPEKDRLLPVKFEPLNLPPDLHELLWVDFTDPVKDEENAALLDRYIRSADAEDARRRRGFRSPPEHGQPGAFPRPPQYGFQGRARELYDLERAFRRDRGIVLHAMGGMGKTALATEAAHWWTRSGLFRDGACFISFERAINADRVIAVLGEYCEGPKFHQRPATEQRKRAIEFFRERAVLMVWDNYERRPAAVQSGAPSIARPGRFGDFRPSNARRSLRHYHRLHRRGAPRTGRAFPGPDQRSGEGLRARHLPAWRHRTARRAAIRAARAGPRGQLVAAPPHPRTRRPFAQRSPARARQARSALARSRRPSSLAGTRRPAPAHDDAGADSRGLRQAGGDDEAGRGSGPEHFAARLAGVLPPPSQSRRPRGVAVARPVQRRRI